MQMRERKAFQYSTNGTKLFCYNLGSWTAGRKQWFRDKSTFL